MDKVCRSTNRLSETSFQSISQLENVLQELNAAIHKKRSPKKRLFKTPKLDDYRRSIIDRALHQRANTSQANNGIDNKKKPNKFISTSTPMPKSFNNKKYVADDSNSSLLISPIAKSLSLPPHNNVTSGDTSQSRSQNYLEKSSQNLSKLNHNSKTSILNEVQLHSQSINKTKSTSKSNKSIKLQNRDQNAEDEEQTDVGELLAIPQIQQETEILPTAQLRNVQQLNKSTNTTKLNNTKTCNDDKLSSAGADVEEFLKDLDNCLLCVNNDSMNETSSIMIRKPWRVSKSFALPKRTFDSLERNSSLVRQLNKKLTKKTYTNKKSFVNKKSLAALKNTQESDDCDVQDNRQVAIFESFMDKPDDNDLDRSDSDLENVAAFISSIVKPTVHVSVRFCDDDSDGESVNNKKTGKKVLRSYGKNENATKSITKTKGNRQNVKKSVKIIDEDDRNSINDNNSISKPSTSKASMFKVTTSKASRSKQNTCQKLNELPVDDGQDEIRLVNENSQKKSTTTKQSSKKAKTTNRKTNNNVKKRSYPSIPETSSSNDNQTQDTNEGIRRSSRVRKQVQFKGTEVSTDSVRIYKYINDTKEIGNRNTTRISKNSTRISQKVTSIIKNKSKKSKLPD